MSDHTKKRNKPDFQETSFEEHINMEYQLSMMVSFSSLDSMSGLAARQQEEFSSILPSVHEMLVMLPPFRLPFFSLKYLNVHRIAQATN